MKHALTLAFLGLLVAIAVNSQQAKKTDIEQDECKGKVKSCLTEDVTLVNKFGTWVEDTRRPNDFWAYDSKGNRTEVASYDADGSLDSKWVYTYDSKGNWITRAEQKQVTKFGKTFLEPTGKAQYRTIAYYP